MGHLADNETNFVTKLRSNRSYFHSVCITCNCTYFFDWAYYIRASFCNLIVLKDNVNLTFFIFFFDFLKYFKMVNISQCTHFFNCAYYIRASFDIAKSLFEILPNGPQCTYCFHRAAVIAVLEMLPDDSLRWTLMNHYLWFIIIIIIIVVLAMLPDD